jgi:O-antigen/teichoic acid export membrane protein
MVLVADVVFTVLLFSGLVAFQYSGGLTLGISLWVLAAASLAAYGAGFYFSMPSLSFRNMSLGKTALENWRFGKWLIGQSMCNWGSGQIYYILSAMLLDMRAPALLKVCATLLAPLHVIFQGLDNILTISIARKLKEGAYAARSFMLKAGALVVGLSAVYVVVIPLFSEYILNILFGGFYSGLSGIVWIFAAAYLFRSISSVPALGLISMHATKDVFLVQLATMATTLVSMYPLLKYWGVTGAAIGMVLIPYFMVAVLTMWRMRVVFHRYAERT